MPQSRLNLTAPLLCLALLGAAVAERSRRLTPTDVEPFHARAKNAINSTRYTIGLWTGLDVPVPTAAQQLLRPNALLSRAYIDNTPGSFRNLSGPTRLSLLIVQCSDPRDMQGHYPPNCYPAHGAVSLGQRPLDLTLDAPTGPLDIHATEYRFSTGQDSDRTTSIVFNTLLIPNVGSTPDMAGVYHAAENYQRRLYGAAQLQIVLPDTLSPERRLEIYRTFLDALAPTLHDLLDTHDIQPDPKSTLNRTSP
jgi:hypothetical protein